MVDHASDDSASKASQNGEEGEQQNGDQRQEKSNGDEEQQDQTPAPVGFWDPRLKHVRKEAFTKWTITTAFLMAFIIACLSIYWGVFVHVEQNLTSLHVWVVDFDGKVAPWDQRLDYEPIVGPMIQKLATQMVDSPKPSLGYLTYDAARFNGDPMEVRQAVYDFKAWAAIIINPNATALLYNAIREGNTSYDPIGACQLVYVQARDSTAWNNYLYPQLAPFMTQAVAEVGKEWSNMVLKNVSSGTDNSALINNIAATPQALSPAIGFSNYNLRPFYPYTTTPAVSVGLIYLIILSFFSFSFYLPIHFKYLKPEGHPPLKFFQLIIWRWVATLSAYFMLSLAYSLISLAFQINFTQGQHHPNPVPDTSVVATGGIYGNLPAYGNGTFPVYWMLNFFGMIALGLACENVAMIVGQPWTGLWLIFWVITNVSTSFYAIEIEPGFYHWGYAWPLYWVVQGSRHLLFDLHSNIGMDFGVLIAWGAVNTILFPFACYFMRWKSKHHVVEYYK